MYLSLTIHGKEQNFSRTKRRKKVDFASFLPTKQQKKKRKGHTGSDKTARNFGLKLFNGTPRFPYKFQETISLILRADYVTTTTTRKFSTGNHMISSAIWNI